MVSFDVSSLFTNVLLKEMVSFINEKLCAFPIICSIPPNVVSDLILMTVQNINFSFGNQTYKQIDGVAMGSLFGPLLADIFLASLESGSMSTMINNSRLYAR